jgi:diguanylate cyclase (GGDEF)-like protein
METWLRLEIYFLCLCVIAVVGFGQKGRRKDNRGLGGWAFVGIIYSTTAMMLLDSASWLFEGIGGRLGHVLVWSSNLAYYAIHSLPLLLFILYADFQLFRDPARSLKLRLPLALPLVLVLAATAVTPFTGFLFTVDAANHYVRGFGFPAFAILSYGLSFGSVFYIIANRKRVPRRVFLSLLAYPLPVIAGGAIQLAFYGLVLLWPAMTFFILVASLNIQLSQAATDHLTGTANRRSLDEELEERVAAARRGHGFGAIMVDLDDFKAINDRFGHEAGDRALEDAATVLRSVVRSDDVVARFGGDEFVIVVGLGDSGRLSEVVDRLRREVAAFNKASGRPYRLSLSVGSGLYDLDADAGPQAFLSRIDGLMYVDKAGRKDR